MTNYTKQDYERDIKILEGAPSRATHFQLVDGDVQFFRIDGLGFWDLDEGDSVVVENVLKIRSLSDIRALVSMYERLQGDNNEWA